jgi:hypothetical protein
MTTKELRDALVKNAEYGPDSIGIKICGHAISENSEYARIGSTVTNVTDAIIKELGEPIDSYVHEETHYLEFSDHWHISTWKYHD